MPHCVEHPYFMDFRRCSFQVPTLATLFQYLGIRLHLRIANVRDSKERGALVESKRGKTMEKVVTGLGRLWSVTRRFLSGPALTFLILVVLNSCASSSSSAASEAHELFWEGFVKWEEGFPQEALLMFDEALRKDVDNAVVFYVQGLAKQDLDQHFGGDPGL